MDDLQLHGIGVGKKPEGDAQAGDVLSGKTFSNAEEIGIVGTMPNRGAVIITPGTTDQAIAAGYHNGSGYVEGDADLVAGNIKNGVTIFGVTGNFASDATAVAGDILSGKTAYVGANKVTGIMPNNGAYNITPGATNKTIPAGYHNGAGVVYGDADLIADNIKSGKTIFGVTGTFGCIKSIQRGIVNFTANAYTMDIPISPVDLNVAVVRIVPYIRWPSTNATIYHVKAKLIDNTTLRLERQNYTSSDHFITYNIIEFNGVKSLQKGDFTLASTTDTVTISAVDISKSLVFNSYKSSNSTLGNSWVSADLDNSTTIRFNCTSGSVMDNHWQVIEFL